MRTCSTCPSPVRFLDRPQTESLDQAVGKTLVRCETLLPWGKKRTALFSLIRQSVEPGTSCHLSAAAANFQSQLALNTFTRSRNRVSNNGYGQRQLQLLTTTFRQNKSIGLQYYKGEQYTDVLTNYTLLVLCFCPRLFPLCLCFIVIKLKL